MGVHPRIDGLTGWQLLIIAYVTEGLTNREIASLLATTEHVIKNNLRFIYDELGMWNRVELAMWYIKQTEGSNEENGRSFSAAAGK